MLTATLCVLALALYLFAGKQTFMLMMLTDPNAATCALAESYRRCDRAFWLTFVGCLLAWPVIFAAASLAPQHD